MAEPLDTDPRLETRSGERDIRPVVERPSAGLSGPALIALAIVAAAVLFVVLDTRRRSMSAPAVSVPRSNVPASTAPPPLYIPSAAPEAPPPVIAAPVPVPVATLPPANPPRPQSPPPSSLVPAMPQPAPPVQLNPPLQRNAGGPALVVDTSQAAGGANSPGRPLPSQLNPLAAPADTDRVRASVFANRATTVPQGTLVPAVLETAFDSTRPGFARALVQRDIRGFDGSQVLIPRGSRIIGEYAADTTQGQKRAMIAWSRLIRPDGVTIALGSPVTDPVGRGGVRANVNSHFLERFAGAILQSSLDVGVNLASRAGNAPVILALPNSVQNTGGMVQRTNEIRPTLSVPAGTSVSVFVARDLDFTDVKAGS